MFHARKLSAQIILNESQLNIFHFPLQWFYKRLDQNYCFWAPHPNQGINALKPINLVSGRNIYTNKDCCKMTVRHIFTRKAKLNVRF